MPRFQASPRPILARNWDIYFSMLSCFLLPIASTFNGLWSAFLWLFPLNPKWCKLRSIMFTYVANFQNCRTSRGLKILHSFNLNIYAEQSLSIIKTYYHFQNHFFHKSLKHWYFCSTLYLNSVLYYVCVLVCHVYQLPSSYI